jgi:hypothetical protein
VPPNQDRATDTANHGVSLGSRSAVRDPPDEAPRTVIGRDPDTDGVTLPIGAYRARDGATGAPVAVDCEHPHVVTVVGKRGSGKSHTLGVIAEGLAAAPGVTPVVVDPMGEFTGLADALDGIAPSPAISADALTPQAWCDLLDLDPTSPAGALVWRAATETITLAAMTDFCENAPVDDATRRAATNHLTLAANWRIFTPDAPTLSDHPLGAPIVLDCSDLPTPAANAVCHAFATDAYHARSTGGLDTLPWLLVDEAHVFYDGTARAALDTLLTRGRTPGVSLLTATQRPSALPTVVHSQTDLTLAHHLTNGHDRTALADAHPTQDLTQNLPTRTGDALVIDDATDTTHHLHVRSRRTPHHGGTPTATELSNDDLSHRDH